MNHLSVFWFLKPSAMQAVYARCCQGFCFDLKVSSLPARWTGYDAGASYNIPSSCTPMSPT
jgi:hypothetical protein